MKSGSTNSRIPKDFISIYFTVDPKLYVKNHPLSKKVQFHPIGKPNLPPNMILVIMYVVHVITTGATWIPEDKVNFGQLEIAA